MTLALPRERGRILGRGAAALALLATLAAPAIARANGRYPAAGQIVIDPSDPGGILVRATYGILVRPTEGAAWSWICEESVGFSGNEDPMMGITADGTILAGIFEGLSVSHDHGCQWDFMQGGLDGKFAIDLSTERGDPAKAIVIISNSSGAPNQFITQLWESSDNGKNWSKAGVDLPSEFLGLTVDAAPSDRNRIYASGRYGAPDYPGVIERSDDRGGAWQKLSIPGAGDTHLPYIGAIDPHNPDVVYVRLDGDPSDQLVVSTDGGLNWTTAFESKGEMLGFALSPDGSKVALGGPADGLWIAPTDTLAFKKVNEVGVRCLTWTDAGIYACADEFVDGFTAGLSTDEGATFPADLVIMHLQKLCGPLACGAGTSTGKLCPDVWGATKLTINAQCGDAGPSTTASSSSSGGTESGQDCACGVIGRGAGLAAPALLIAGVASLLARRRARR